MQNSEEEEDEVVHVGGKFSTKNRKSSPQVVRLRQDCRRRIIGPIIDTQAPAALAISVPTKVETEMADITGNEATGEEPMSEWVNPPTNAMPMTNTGTHLTIPILKQEAVDNSVNEGSQEEEGIQIRITDQRSIAAAPQDIYDTAPPTVLVPHREQMEMEVDEPDSVAHAHCSSSVPNPMSTERIQSTSDGNSQAHEHQHISMEEDQVQSDVARGPPVVFSDAQASSSTNSGVDWRAGKSISELMEYVYEHDEGTHKDVTFYVGPEQEEISAHKHFLGFISPVFEYAFFDHPVMKNKKGHLDIMLEDVQPSTFRLLLKYIYVRRVEVALDEAVDLLKAALRFKLPDLAAKCMTKLRTDLKADNAATILQAAWEMPESSEQRRLKDCALAVIASHAKKVLSTPGFLNLSHDALRSILGNDHLDCDEWTVFKAAKSWAENSIKKRNQTEDVKILDSDIRAELGDVLFKIRFSHIPMKYATKTNILTDREKLQILKGQIPSLGYEEDYPFPTAPRIRRTTIAAATSSTNEDVAGGSESEERPPRDRESGEPPNKIQRLDSNDPVGPRDTDEASTVVGVSIADSNTASPLNQDRMEEAELADPIPSTSQVETNDDTGMDVEDDGSESVQESDHEDEQQSEDNDDSNSNGPGFFEEDRVSDANAPPSPPPKEKKKKNDKMLTETQEKYIQANGNSSGGNNLFSLIENLRIILEFQDSEPIQIIREEQPVVINNLNTMPLAFPYLTDFHIHYLVARETVKSFQAYLKQLNIAPLLFFKSFNSIKDLGDLCKVEVITDEEPAINITLVINGVTVLKLDFRECSLLTLSGIKTSAKEILAGFDSNAGATIRLREIHLDECSTSLDVFQAEYLEKITLRRITLNINHGAFLKKCKNLTEFSCSDLHLEILDFGDHLGIFTPEGTKLRRLALGRAKIFCSKPLSKLNNQVEELYLDKCSFNPDFVEGFHLIFPNLKKLKICRNFSLKLFHNALKISSLEWVGVWELEWKQTVRKGKGKGKGKTPNQETETMISEIMAILKAAGFNDKWINSKNKAFILERIKTKDAQEFKKDVQSQVEGRSQEDNYEFDSDNDNESLPGPSQPGGSGGSGLSTQGNGGWKGTQIGDRFEEFTKLDYEQFNWTMFYEDYDLFYKLNSK